MRNARKPYPSDVSDEEWALVAPCPTLLPEAAGQREHPLREVFDGLRYIVKTGAPWRWMPNDPPPWHAVHQQAQRWLAAGCFAALADLRACPPPGGGPRGSRAPRSWTAGRCAPRPRVASGPATPVPGASRAPSCTWRWIRAAISLASHVTSASVDDRAEVDRLAGAVQASTGQSVGLAHVDRGYTGQKAADAAKKHGIELEVVKLPEAKKGCVLLPRRWIVERSSPGPPASGAW